MIIKTKDGNYFELTEKEYIQFVAEVLVHFQMEHKLEVSFHQDGRVKAAEMIFAQIAKEGAIMGDELRKNYLKLGHELLSSYHQDIENGNLKKPKQ